MTVPASTHLFARHWAWLGIGDLELLDFVVCDLHSIVGAQLRAHLDVVLASLMALDYANDIIAIGVRERNVCVFGEDHFCELMS